LLTVSFDHTTSQSHTMELASSNSPQTLCEEKSYVS